MWWRRGVLTHAHGVLRPAFEPTCLSTVLYYSGSPPEKKGKATTLQERRIVDRFRLCVKGGEGGTGCWSYHRSRKDRRGTPDGGNGGRGGNVYLECSEALWDFSNLQHHLNAKKGGNGSSKNLIGTRGLDKVAHVPVGTVIHLVSGSFPIEVRTNSITNVYPWEISVAAEDSSSPAERNELVYNKVKPSNLLKKGDIASPKDESRKSAYSKPNEFKSNMFEAKDERCDESLSDQDLQDQDGDKWLDDDNEWWNYDKHNEDNKECLFELEEEVQYSVTELTQPGQRILVAQGGMGGLGNAALSKDTKYRKLMKPDGQSDVGTLDNNELFSLIVGTPGVESVFILELKSIADVGLVGIPNAGKSTLLGAISRANPAVGHYAFTTLRPNIGNLNYDDFFSVSVADIPGLIKGAHENRGLGHAFLRHIERTKVLAYVVDLAAALDGKKGIMPWEQLKDLVMELELHKVGLSKRPSLIVANKIDVKGAEDVYEELKTKVHGAPIFPICAVLGEGVPELKVGLRRLMEARKTGSLELINIIVD